MPGEGALRRLRADGWMVAAHNDYRDSDGNGCTFWLFTKGDRCVKGEGYTDAIALERCLVQVFPEEAEG